MIGGSSARSKARAEDCGEVPVALLLGLLFMRGRDELLELFVDAQRNEIGVVLGENAVGFVDVDRPL
jgi:hypothetical protein